MKTKKVKNDGILMLGTKEMKEKIKNDCKTKLLISISNPDIDNENKIKPEWQKKFHGSLSVKISLIKPEPISDEEAEKIAKFILKYKKDLLEQKLEIIIHSVDNLIRRDNVAIAKAIFCCLGLANCEDENEFTDYIVKKIYKTYTKLK